MLNMYLENVVFKQMARLARNQVVQTTSKNRVPRLEAKFRKLGILAEAGFTPLDDDQVLIQRLRKDAYFVDAKTAEKTMNNLEDEVEMRLFENLLLNNCEDDDGDVLEQMLNSTLGNERYERSMELVAESLPNWLNSNNAASSMVPRRRVIGLFLEANTLVPITERSQFMYLVKPGGILSLC